MLKRITPQDVRQSYEKIGYKPIQGRTNTFHSECCGFAAFLRALGYEPSWWLEIIEYAQQFGFVEDYVRGFIEGFDGNSMSESRTAWEIGHADGKDAWEEVKSLVGVPV